MFDGLSEWKLEKTYQRQIVAWWFNEKLRNRFVSLSTAHSTVHGLFPEWRSHVLEHGGTSRRRWHTAADVVEWSQLMSCWLLITERFGVVKLSQIAMWKREKITSQRMLRNRTTESACKKAKVQYQKRREENVTNCRSKKVNECDEPLKEMRFRADFMLQLIPLSSAC